MDATPLVLCLGKKPRLLAIRKGVLATRYTVVTIQSPEDVEALPADSVFDVLVLCHTVPDSECEQVGRLAHQRWPHIKILTITTASSGFSECDSDFSIGSLDGPDATFAGIARLLHGLPDRKPHNPYH